MKLPWHYKSEGKIRSGVTAQALRREDRRYSSIEKQSCVMTRDGTQALEPEISQLLTAHRVSVKETRTGQS